MERLRLIVTSYVLLFSTLDRPQISAKNVIDHLDDSYPDQKYPFPCKNQTHFSDEQKAFCNQHESVTLAMVAGAVEALAFCKREMATEQWDCTSTYEGDNKLIYVEDDGGSREAAFLTAMRAAGMLDSLTMAYWDGGLSCPEEYLQKIQPLYRNYILYECPDITQHAQKFVIDFMSKDKMPPQRTDSWYIAKHNAKVGIKIIEHLMSCNFRISNNEPCVQRLPEKQRVARLLHQLYDRAVQVKVRRENLFGHNDDHVIEEISAPYKQRRYRRRAGSIREFYADQSVENDDDGSLDYLKLYYLVGSETYQEYCSRGVRRGRTCHRETTKRKNATSDNNEVHRIRHIIRSCKRLCCNDVLEEAWVRFVPWDDGSVAEERVCP